MKNTYLSGIVIILCGLLGSLSIPPVERIEIARVIKDTTFVPVKIEPVKVPVIKKPTIKKPLNIAGNPKVFIAYVAPIAQAEQKIHNIPASITIAQAILESSWGTSRLATEANNYFGIKCWCKGTDNDCIRECDEDCQQRFKTYPNMWRSFRAHSLFLDKEKYRWMKGRGWRFWADNLGPSGYATSKVYGKSLRSIIIRYKLYRYDL